MFRAGFVSRIPYISKADARMEPVEHDQRQADVTEDAPQHFSVESVSLVQALRGLVGECVEEPHSDVGDEQKHEQLPTGL